ncbi:MAG: type II toxin-antitoxin system RelE/ParE family toxin [Bacteroidia bacterium]
MVKDLQVVWSNQAIEVSKKIIDYIVEQWGVASAMDFIQETSDFVELLSKNSKLCPESKKKNLRKCLVSKQVSLIYQIEKNKISIVTLIDNRSNHHF